MDKLLNIGRYLFPLSFLMYVGLHLGKPEVGASFVPDYLPFPLFWNYVTMVSIVLFIVSALLGKYDKLAYSLMALYVILMALLVHLPRSMGYELDHVMMMTDAVARERELETINIFRNIMVSGALLGFARYVAKDKRVIG
ncbi:MAG: hypothetical protein KF856_01955 [Cyclobacteriaceae bacterium]|nr:hypothetical protein [Cyclobacteriaceae bacterium]